MDQPRSLTLGNTPVPYTLRRARRRTIGLTVDHRGLTVAAPLRARIGDVEHVLRQHESWVLGKLTAWENRPQPSPVVVADGLSFPWLGQTFTLHLDTLHTGRRNLALWGERQLTLCIKPDQDIALAFRKVLKAAALAHFSQRLAAVHATHPGLPSIPPLRLTAAKTRWGSCSQKALRLNWRLMHLTPAIVDYVVAHELAHLLEMNHSPRFWAVVEQLYPDWQQARRTLRQQGPTCPSF